MEVPASTNINKSTVCHQLRHMIQSQLCYSQELCAKNTFSLSMLFLKRAMPLWIMQCASHTLSPWLRILKRFKSTQWRIVVSIRQGNIPRILASQWSHSQGFSISILTLWKPRYARWPSMNSRKFHISTKPTTFQPTIARSSQVKSSSLIATSCRTLMTQW